MDKRSQYWFAAKRRGWGWGLPLSWQGWAVYIVWMLVFFAFAPFRRIAHEPVAWFAFLGGMIGVLIAICYWKGEPPRWRWGDDD